MINAKWGDVDISVTSQSIPSLVQTVLEVLGPGGRLARTWPDYESRPGQLIMAQEVARAFQTQDVAIIEAGTGTGKTMAYLVPALLSGKKTVVSTGTKNLQEQIYYKDIPFIRRHLGSGFKSAYLKGRENYLCRYYFDHFLRQPVFPAVREAVYLDRLVEWVKKTSTGDRAELTDIPEDLLTWSELTANKDRCLGSKCPSFKDCFLQQARKAAAAADLVVVNHHLFMADLVVRAGGVSEVIPGYEAVVFDEAHQVEDVATQHFGLAVSSWRLAGLRRDTDKTLELKRLKTPATAQAMTAFWHQADALFKEFSDKPEEFPLWAVESPEMDRLRDQGRKVVVNLDNLAARLEGLKVSKQDKEEIEGLVNRTREASRDLDFIITGEAPDFVYWAERRQRGVFLRASPIEVGPFLNKLLYDRHLSIAFASATLTTQGDFNFFKERMGIFPEVAGVVVDSPFEYQRQTLLYVPKSFPFPGMDGYLSALVGEIEKLLTLSEGRAFVLFTSYRNLKYASDILVDRLPWTCLIQGQAPRTALLERFRQDTSSVLLATHSFWQGVDVPGESLSAVIIDKLPFPRPDQPLVKARSERMKAEGHDPFLNYHVPDAIITLKQGLGRLIRTGTDRGLLAVLDSRLVNKGYGRRFLESLPPSPLSHDLAEVRKFFQKRLNG